MCFYSSVQTQQEGTIENHNDGANIKYGEAIFDKDWNVCPIYVTYAPYTFKSPIKIIIILLFSTSCRFPAKGRRRCVCVWVGGGGTWLWNCNSLQLEFIIITLVSPARFLFPPRLCLAQPVVGLALFSFDDWRAFGLRFAVLLVQRAEKGGRTMTSGAVQRPLTTAL